MTDRLQELLRQKALLAEHAAWLEREIAAEQAVASIIAAHPASAASPSVRPDAAPGDAFPAARPALAPTAPGAAISEGNADAILQQYRDSTKSIHNQVLRGCLVYLALALLLLCGGVAAIFFFYHRH